MSGGRRWQHDEWIQNVIPALIRFGKRFFFSSSNATEQCNNLNHVPAWLVHSCTVKKRVWNCSQLISDSKKLANDSETVGMRSTSARCERLILTCQTTLMQACKKNVWASSFILKWRPRKKAILHQACSQVVSVPLAWRKEQHRGLLNVTEETRVAGDKDTN